MKLEVAKQDVQINGNFPVSNFAIGNVGFITDMFADKVYSNKELAVVREICCNAYDSHVVAGKKDVPFDVHLPTHFEPFFSVRDYGTGLSENEVRNIFAGIGISTKRESNDVIGCFGIGSLSPYALVDSFTVKSWHNGKCNTYSCYRDDNRAPVVALLTSVDSPEPCGLEVSLTVENKVNVFHDAAIQTFRFWDNVPNLNDALVAEKCREWKDSTTTKGDGYVVTSLSDNYAVMGNVGYRIPYSVLPRITGVMLYFDMGEISFDTARENLSLDDKTRAAIASKVESFIKDAKRAYKSELDSLQTEFEKWHHYINVIRPQMSKFGWQASDFGVKHLEIKSGTTYKNRWGNKTHKSNGVNPEGAEYYLKSANRDSADSRVRLYLNTYPDKRVVLIDQQTVDEYNIPSHMYRHVTDLPKPPAKSRTYQSNKHSVYTFNVAAYGSAKDYWNEAEIDTNDLNICVEIKGFSPVGICLEDLKTMINTLSAFGVKVPNVIGLKSTFLKTKAFKNGLFVDFQSYCRTEFYKIIKSGKIYAFNDLFWGRFEKLEILSTFISNKELVDFFSKGISSLKRGHHVKAIQICQSLGLLWEDQEPSDHQEIKDFVNGFFDKYCMLEVLDCWDISSNKKILEKYLNVGN